MKALELAHPGISTCTKPPALAAEAGSSNPHWRCCEGPVLALARLSCVVLSASLIVGPSDAADAALSLLPISTAISSAEDVTMVGSLGGISGRYESPDGSIVIEGNRTEPLASFRILSVRPEGPESIALSVNVADSSSIEILLSSDLRSWSSGGVIRVVAGAVNVSIPANARTQPLFIRLRWTPSN